MRSASLRRERRVYAGADVDVDGEDAEADEANDEANDEA